MKKSKMILFALAVLIAFAGKTLAQDGSEYLLWEKTKDFTTRDVAINMDETQIAVLAEYTDTETYFVKILSILTGDELFSIQTAGLAWNCFYTTDGKYLVVRCENNLILDAKTYSVIKKLPSGGISFSADNRYISLTGKGFKFSIVSTETFETVYEQNLPEPESDETGGFRCFFTPNNKYLIAGLGFNKKPPSSGSRSVQEIFDAKTFQKVDRTINCLKNYGTFSNTGLCANTYSKGGLADLQPIGFRIYDYDKDSLIWEQETKNYNNLIFLNTKNYLISRFDTYEPGNPEMKVFNTWNLSTKLRDKNIFCAHMPNSKISRSDKYLCATNTGTIWLYDFEKMFEGNVSVNEPLKSIEININIQSDSNLIRLSNLSNDIASITIYDLSGNLVDIIYKGNSITYTINYNTARLTKGVYLVKIDTEKESITKKLIIE